MMKADIFYPIHADNARGFPDIYGILMDGRVRKEHLEAIIQPAIVYGNAFELANLDHIVFIIHRVTPKAVPVNKKGSLVEEAACPALADPAMKLGRVSSI
jgi:hypothetical protein